MQMPEMNKYESLVEKALKPSQEELHPLTFSDHPFQPNMKELLNNIQEVNLARSFSLQPLRDTSLPQPLMASKSHHCSEETLSYGDSGTVQSERTARASQPRRSLIFASRKFAKRKEEKGETIRVYFFDLPVYKDIKYTQTSTIADLIADAIENYLEDDSLDHYKIRDRQVTNYEMRMLANQQGFKGDLKLPPIGLERVLHDNLFDSLVLRAKERKERKYSEEAVRLLRGKPTSSLNRSRKVSILLLNEVEEQLGSLQMEGQEQVGKIFQHIESNELHNMRSYYLTENKNDTDGLPADFQVRNLESNRIYIKAKRYIDESDFENRVRPIRNITIVGMETQLPLQMPIGLAEASRYEEFEVRKVNSRGVQQERILGVDQTKIYNYDKQHREEKKEQGFFSRLLGLDEQTNTKKPFRPISDILSLAKLQNGVVLKYKEKELTYLIEKAEQRDRFYRKVSYLVEYRLKEQQKGSPRKRPL